MITRILSYSIFVSSSIDSSSLIIKSKAINFYSYLGISKGYNIPYFSKVDYTSLILLFYIYKVIGKVTAINSLIKVIMERIKKN